MRLSFATEVRKAHEAVVRTKDFDYNAVLAIDAAYRNILESLPTRWSHPDEPGKPDFQRHFIVEGVNNRLFRLHRPFSTRGYLKEQYAYSTKACLKSAREIIVSTSQIHDSVLEITFSYSHCFSATLVLFNDLFHTIDVDEGNASDIEEKTATLKLASQMFARGEEVTSTNLRKIVDQGFRVITGLFSALEKRQNAHLLLALGGERAEADVESFAAVLDRLGHSLATYERHEGTPPPSRRMPTLPPVPEQNWPYPGGESDDLYRFLNADMMGGMITPGSMFDATTFNQFQFDYDMK